MAYGDLCKKIDSLQAVNSVHKAELLIDANTIPNVATKAKPSLLIGSEMIKDLEPLDPNKLTVKCFRMPNSMIITNIIIAEMSKNDQQKFETIRAVAGNHVCETDSTIIEITESATETVNFAL